MELEIIERKHDEFPYVVRWVGEDTPCSSGFRCRTNAEKWIKKLQAVLAMKSWSVQRR